MLYVRYYTIFYSIHPLITTELGPIVILTSLNILIFNTVTKNKRRWISNICMKKSSD